MIKCFFLYIIPIQIIFKQTYSTHYTMSYQDTLFWWVWEVISFLLGIDPSYSYPRWEGGNLSNYLSIYVFSFKKKNKETFAQLGR